MKFNKLASIIIFNSFLSTNLYAASIDFRHEYKGKTKEHASRIKLGNTFENNLAISVELKFKGKDGDFMQDLQQNGSELSINYKYAINSQWAIQPGMPIEFGTGTEQAGNATYKPQLAIIYTPETIQGLSVSGRYRLDYKPGQTNVDAQNKEFRDRYTANVGYQFNNISLGLEVNYYQSHDPSYILYDNKNTNYENNLAIRYNVGDWTPWVELGDVSVDSTSDLRELRSRIGISYSF